MTARRARPSSRRDRVSGEISRSCRLIVEPTAPAWRPPTSSKVYGARLAAHFERARREVGRDAFELYLLGFLVASDDGRITKDALAAMDAALNSGEITVGYDRLADGGVRVWYREVAS